MPNGGWEYNIVQFAEWERKQGTRDGSRQNILQENQAGWGGVRKVMHGSDGEGSSEIGKGCGNLRRDMCDARRGDKSMYACQRSGLGE